MDKNRLAKIVMISALAVAISKSFSTIGNTVNLTDFLIIFFTGIGAGIYIKIFIDKQKGKSKI